MEQRKENWLLTKINESIKKNGKVDESCLKLIYTQINYRNEFLELLKEIKNESCVVAYLFMKENNSCMELLEDFENRQKVKDYLYMANQIKMVDEVMESVRNGGWCHHILVSNGNNYRCIRCGVTINSDLDCNDYIVMDSLDYDEARILYETVIDDVKYEYVNNIVDGMILLRNEQKVKRKNF